MDPLQGLNVPAPIPAVNDPTAQTLEGLAVPLEELASELGAALGRPLGVGGGFAAPAPSLSTAYPYGAAQTGFTPLAGGGLGPQNYLQSQFFPPSGADPFAGAPASGGTGAAGCAGCGESMCAYEEADAALQAAGSFISCAESCSSCASCAQASDQQQFIQNEIQLLSQELSQIQQQVG